jgi:hypothetical protein
MALVLAREDKAQARRLQRAAAARAARISRWVNMTSKASDFADLKRSNALGRPETDTLSRVGIEQATYVPVGKRFRGPPFARIRLDTRSILRLALDILGRYSAIYRCETLNGCR